MHCDEMSRKAATFLNAETEKGKPKKN